MPHELDLLEGLKTKVINAGSQPCQCGRLLIRILNMKAQVHRPGWQCSARDAAYSCWEKEALPVSAMRSSHLGLSRPLPRAPSRFQILLPCTVTMSLAGVLDSACPSSESLSLRVVLRPPGLPSSYGFFLQFWGGRGI